ncbi:MAG: hypothetical protein JWN70_7225 [Planctomycetaceae bacterium]|nr:hypothetical protein [Planctomycetaceae bacterium]
MKTWMWTRTALSVLVLGLISISVGCQDAPKPMTGGGELAPGKTAPPAIPASGSGLSGGVEVPPPVQPDATDKKPAEGDKPAADAKPAEGDKPAADAKPEAEKPAEEAKPAEEKKPE